MNVNEGPNAPFVVIGMVTYNHEKFIEQAIESVMTQETAFSYKLFIFEDCSKDSTRQICIRLKEKYPNKIELVLNEKNMGAALNGYNMHRSILASGTSYGSFLDGDDYWVDKKKLQKQVDVLEKDKTLSLCFTAANVLKEKTGEVSARGNDQTIPDVMNCDTFIREGNPYNTCTSMFRMAYFPRDIGNWFPKVLKQDWALFVMLLHKGDAYYLRETTAVYRVHGESMFRSTTSIDMEENSAFLLDHLRQYFYPHQQKALDNALTWCYFHLAFDYWHRFRIAPFFKNISLAASVGEKKTFGWYWLVLKQMILNPIKDVYHKIFG